MPSQELSPAMAARYGLDRGAWRGRAVAAVVVTAFLVVVAALTVHLASGGVQSTLLRFVVVDDHRVDVTFQLQRDAGSDTVCVLRAQSETHADVGYATVTVSAGRPDLEVTYSLATASRAVSGEVLGCAAGTAPSVDPPQFLPGTTNPLQVPTVDGT